MLLPDAARAVLQKPLVVRMAVNDPEGYPHVVPVWFGLDGDDLMIFGFYNTRKIGYIKADPRGSVQIGGELGNDGYLLKGTYALETDIDNQWAKKITYAYEADRANADKLLAEWTANKLFLVRFVVNKVMKV
jgi:general stress protein 26